MGLTKDYLRFIPSSQFNAIASSNCNIAQIKASDTEKHIRYIASGAAESVIIWDCKLSRKVHVFEGDKHECTQLACHAAANRLAAGYKDGTVEMFDCKSYENLGTFSGHSAAVTSLSFDDDGHRLASGSMDTDVAVWDVVAEQGLFRLSGHKGSITQVKFMQKYDVIVTSSKDTFIKFWDLKNGHCFNTLTGHITEVWCFSLMYDNKYLICGSNDSELRVWKIEPQDQVVEIEDSKTDDIDYFGPFKLQKLGSILRAGFRRVVSLNADETSRVLCCHGIEKLIELFYFVDEEETTKRYQKKVKKLKKKFEPVDENAESSFPAPDSLSFCVTRLPAVNAEHRVRSALISFDKVEKKAKVVCSTFNNTIEIHSVQVAEKKTETEKIISSHGHSSNVRCVAFDEGDCSTLVSGSDTSIKVWNRSSSKCVRTIDSEFVLSICCVPDGRYVLAGLKNGSLIIVDIASADIIETIEAHTKEVWRVSVLPNKKSCVTCGGDSTVKIWNFEFSAGIFSITHTRTLKLDESVLDVCVSRDSNLVATALLDSTVKIFFMENFKFFLNLYGHKMPVTCLDISDDSTLIATGSADRCVKIWGLDFGDCHRSILAHEDNVTGLKFLPGTHFFFTCAKDGLVKQWDADNFQRIVTLNGHRSEASGLSVSSDGYFVATVGHDRVIRIYEKSDEPVVLEDERETERQEEEESTLATGPESIVPGRGVISMTSKKTVNSERGAELLLECLQTIERFESEGNMATLPEIMIAFKVSSSEEYLRAILRKIRASDLEEILSLLPFNYACLLLQKLVPLLKIAHYETEVICRVVVFLLRVHHKPIVSSQNLLITLRRLLINSQKTVHFMKDIVGYNLYALLSLQREREAEENVRLFEETIHNADKILAKKRKKQSLMRTAVLKL